MNWRHAIADWLMRKELDESDKQLDVTPSKRPGRILNKLRVAKALRDAERDTSHEYIQMLKKISKDNDQMKEMLK
jgi:hypothetical protein